MTEFRFSNSTCQIEGEIVPVAELALAAGDSVFFEHHVVLWKEPGVPLSALSTRQARNSADDRRHAAHHEAWRTGPGRIALSKDATGEVGGPADPPVARELDVREHAFLAASGIR